MILSSAQQSYLNFPLNGKIAPGNGILLTTTFAIILILIIKTWQHSGIVVYTMASYPRGERFKFYFRTVSVEFASSTLVGFPPGTWFPPTI